MPRAERILPEEEILTALHQDFHTCPRCGERRGWGWAYIEEDQTTDLPILEGYCPKCEMYLQATFTLTTLIRRDQG